MSEGSAGTFKNLDELCGATLAPDLEELEIGHESNPRAVPADTPWPSLPASLKLLVIWASQLENVTFVDGLSLRALYLSGKDTLEDIGALARQSELESLVLDAHSLADFSPLRELALQFLMAKRSRISSWEDLPRQTLRWLDLSKTRIKSGPDQRFERLEYLALTQSSIGDLRALESCPNLRRIHLWKTRRAFNFSALRSCAKLNIVNLNETTASLQDIEQLLELPELTILACAKTPASEAPDFAKLQARAKERNINLCGTHREFSAAHGFELRDLSYYLRVHQGERNPLRHLSRMGYRCGYDD